METHTPFPNTTFWAFGVGVGSTLAGLDRIDAITEGSKRSLRVASGPVAMRERTEAAVKVASKGSSVASGSSSFWSPRFSSSRITRRAVPAITRAISSNPGGGSGRNGPGA